MQSIIKTKGYKLLGVKTKKQARALVSFYALSSELISRMTKEKTYREYRKIAVKHKLDFYEMGSILLSNNFELYAWDLL